MPIYSDCSKPRSLGTARVARTVEEAGLWTTASPRKGRPILSVLVTTPALRSNSALRELNSARTVSTSCRLMTSPTGRPFRQPLQPNSFVDVHDSLGGD